MVRAELRIETPMKEMADRTLLTLSVAVWVNWREKGGGEGGRERGREGGREGEGKEGGRERGREREKGG